MITQSAYPSFAHSSHITPSPVTFQTDLVHLNVSLHKAGSRSQQPIVTWHTQSRTTPAQIVHCDVTHMISNNTCLNNIPFSLHTVRSNTSSNDTVLSHTRSKATWYTYPSLPQKVQNAGRGLSCFVSRFGLAVRRQAGKHKDLDSIPLRLSYLFTSYGLCTLSNCDCPS